MTKAQINRIATVSDKGDFRFFTDAKGETVVVICEPEKLLLFVYSDGSTMIIAPSGNAYGHFEMTAALNTP